jgi:hypothetical protein
VITQFLWYKQDRPKDQGPVDRDGAFPVRHNGTKQSKTDGVDEHGAPGSEIQEARSSLYVYNRAGTAHLGWGTYLLLENSRMDLIS